MTRLNLTAIACICLLIPTFPLGAIPDCEMKPSPEFNRKVGAYLSALENLEQNRDLPGLYEKAQGLDDLEIIDELNDLYGQCPEKVDQLGSRLGGMSLQWHGEVVVIYPEWAFFARVARDYGSEDDREFFQLMQIIHPEQSSWKVWQHPMTDYAALLDVAAVNSSGVLKEMTSFLQTYKQSPYREYVQEEFNELVDWLAHETRYGNTRENVLKGYGKVCETLHPNLRFWSRRDNRFAQSYDAVNSHYQAIKAGDERFQFEFTGPF